MLVETKARTTDELNHINDYLCDLFSGRAAEFYLALHIMVQSQQLWLLNSGTLRFFYQLHERSIPIFDQLLNSLTTLCHNEKYLLSIQSHHIDTVVSSLNMDLIDNTLSLLAPYCDLHAPHLESIIESLTKTNVPYILEQASTHNLVHHSLAHALEIVTRSMHLLCHALGVFNMEDNVHFFLQKIASLMIEFHDHEQKIKDPSVEHTTAKRVSKWLIDSLGAETIIPPFVTKLIHFMADRIIILGTTMIYSPVRTMDLFELFRIVEQAALMADIYVKDTLNTALIEMIEATALITSLCDKNPAAALPVVTQQYSTPQTASLANLRRYFQAPLLFESFFHNEEHRFNLYFDDEHSHAAIHANIQAFFITFNPHLLISSLANFDRCALSR